MCVCCWVYNEWSIYHSIHTCTGNTSAKKCSMFDVRICQPRRGIFLVETMKRFLSSAIGTTLLNAWDVCMLLSLQWMSIYHSIHPCTGNTSAKKCSMFDHCCPVKTWKKDRPQKNGVKKITEQAVFLRSRKRASPNSYRDLSPWYLRIQRIYGASSLAIGLRSNF